MATLSNYHWDPIDDVVILETDQSATAVVTYTHEPGEFGQLVNETRDGVDAYYHFDALGSTTFLTDDTGNVTDTFSYDSWGIVISHEGETSSRYLWKGRWGYQFDIPTADYYIRARTFQPNVVRWRSLDPLDPVSSSNRFQYCESSPVNKVDPSGLLSITDLIDRFLPAFAHITAAPCGNVAWNVKLDGTATASLLGVPWTEPIFQNLPGEILFPVCHRGSQCCIAVRQNFTLSGRIKGTITGIRLRGWLVRPSVSFDVAFSFIEGAEIGVCVEVGCPCPQTIIEIKHIRLGTIDLGTITFPPSPFPPLDPADFGL